MMDRSRGQLLARAGFAVDQDPPVGRRSHGNLLAKRANRHAFADHLIVVFKLLAEPYIVRFELALAERVANGKHGAIYLKRLLDEVERTQPRCSHGRFDAAVTADHYDRGLGIGGFQPLEGFDAVDARKPHVKKNTTEQTPLEECKTLLTRCCRLDRHAPVFEHARERAPDSFFILHDEK